MQNPTANRDKQGQGQSRSPPQSPTDPVASFFPPGNCGVGESRRFTVKEVIGKGSYGIVCAAVDNLTGQRVAIKRIQNVFEHVADATRILREIKLLRLLKHPDIVEIKHIMLPPDPRTYKDIYVVFELMESDLHTVIGANDDLTPDHHKVFLFQLLRALAFIHETGVLHRDLKPKNILANSNCKLKICDFGLARPFVGEPTSTNWTDYVATRWYRAPELCGCFYGCYSHAVDIWSIGCIFAETLVGKPLFPGREAVSQLQLITDLVGKPSIRTIDRIPNAKARTFLHALPPKASKDFAAKFPKTDPLALDLLRDLLSFDPSDRPSAQEALNHPYFQGLPRLQPAELPLIRGQFDFELGSTKITEADVRSLIYMEALNYHPHVMSQFNASKCQLSSLMSQVDGSHCNDLQHQFMHAESMAAVTSAPAPPAAPAAPAASATISAYGTSSGPSCPANSAPGVESWQLLAAQQQHIASSTLLSVANDASPSSSAAASIAAIRQQQQEAFQMMAMQQFQSAYDYHISCGHPPNVAASLASQQTAALASSLLIPQDQHPPPPHCMLST